MNVPFFRSCISEEEKANVMQVLSSGSLTRGEAVREFESRFATYLGAAHAVAVNSFTSALHLALGAAGVRRDDVVLIPTISSDTSVEAVTLLGARPALVDCDPVTLCIDPDAVEATAIQSCHRGTLKAIIPVHYGGQMADMDRVSEVVQRCGMRVIEDGAHALPAFIRKGPRHSWRSVGSTSPLTCFSFSSNQCITAGEGGMVVTSEPELAEHIRMMVCHGHFNGGWTGFEDRASWYDEIREPMHHCNLSDVTAAIGLAQLEKADDFWYRRRSIAHSYSTQLAQYSDFLELPREMEDRKSAWHLYPIKLYLNHLDMDRGSFVTELQRLGIDCLAHWMPLHLRPYFRETYGYWPQDFPVASAQWPRLVSLPIYPCITEDEVGYVCECVGSIIRKHAAKRSLMAVGPSLKAAFSQ